MYIRECVFNAAANLRLRLDDIPVVFFSGAICRWSDWTELWQAITIEIISTDDDKWCEHTQSRGSSSVYTRARFKIQLATALVVHSLLSFYSPTFLSSLLYLFYVSFWLHFSFLSAACLRALNTYHSYTHIIDGKKRDKDKATTTG